MKKELCVKLVIYKDRMKIFRTKFHINLWRGSPADSCGRTDGHDEANRRFPATKWTILNTVTVGYSSRTSPRVLIRIWEVSVSNLEQDISYPHYEYHDVLTQTRHLPG